jgi:DNA-binding HxlR family transcriptional regulator
VTNKHQVIARAERTPQDEPEDDAKSKIPAIFIGRWTPKILFSLKERPHRHGELRRHVGNVSQRMLTRTLRNLESRGLIARRVARSKPIAVEYSLSKLGRTIIAPLSGMCRWAKRHGKYVSADVHFPEAGPAAGSQPISPARHTDVPNCANRQGLANCAEQRKRMTSFNRLFHREVVARGTNSAKEKKFS